MINLSTVNRLRLSVILNEHGLNKPLGEEDIALELLSLKLRLEELESKTDILEKALPAGGIPAASSKAVA